MLRQLRGARGSVRHLLALILAAGTTAGTLFTFSGGRLTLTGASELLVSVGGVALALELGVIYCAVYLGNLAELIHSARARERREQLQAQYRERFYWFLGVLAISVLANIIFRAQQLHNVWLGAFVGVAPGPLIVLFAVKLRRLEVDYDERARQSAQEAMVAIVEASGRTLKRFMGRIADGEVLSEAEMRQLRLAGAFLLPRALPQEREALSDAMELGMGAPLAIEASATEWISSADVAQRYGVPRRTAQLWIKQLPGSAKTARGREVLADAGRLYTVRGVPQPGVALVSAPPARATTREAGAGAAQLSAEVA